MAKDLAAHSQHARPDLVGRRLERERDRLLDPVEVVGIHHEGTTKFGGGTGELAQDELAGQIAATRHVLLGDQVHTVTKRRHEHDVGGQVESHQFLEGQVLVQVMDDRTAHESVVAVHRTDDLLEIVALEVVVRVGLTTRHRHLHHHVRAPHQLADGVHLG